MEENNEAMMSPSIKDKVEEVKTLNFGEAVQKIVEGSKVTKLEWGNGRLLLFKGRDPSY
jgi:hypothetical protein